MGEIKYESKLTRAQCRMLYVRCETTTPRHKSALKWMAATCAELYAAADVAVKNSGEVQAKPFEADAADSVVPLPLTRDAVLGVKYAVIAALDGAETGKPASSLERRTLLAAAMAIGPDGVLKRLIESEAKLPDFPEADDKSIAALTELEKTMQPKKEA